LVWFAGGRFGDGGGGEGLAWKRRSADPTGGSNVEDQLEASGEGEARKTSPGSLPDSAP